MIMTLPLLYDSDPRLHIPSDPVPDGYADLDSLVANLFATMEHERGYGLSACQVGVNLRLFVIQHEQVKFECINPIITWESEVLSSINEGCLSYPGEYHDIIRPSEIKVEYKTLSGTRKTPKLRGMVGRIFIHELDHCNGIVFRERITNG